MLFVSENGEKVEIVIMKGDGRGDYTHIEVWYLLRLQVFRSRSDKKSFLVPRLYLRLLLPEAICEVL